MEGAMKGTSSSFHLDYTFYTICWLLQYTTSSNRIKGLCYSRWLLFVVGIFVAVLDARIFLPFQGHPYHTDGLTCLAITSDSTLALTGSKDSSVHIVNIATGKV